MGLTNDFENKKLAEGDFENAAHTTEEDILISKAESNEIDQLTINVSLIKDTVNAVNVATENDNKTSYHSELTDLSVQKSPESFEELNNDEQKSIIQNNNQELLLVNSFNNSISLNDQQCDENILNNYQKDDSITKSVLSPFAPEYQFKHPLQNTWTLWYLESDRTKSWEELQTEITSFNTVEDFWCIYHQIKLASTIKIGCDYSLFKTGIRPMWEDENNIDGGRWIITIGRQCRKDYLDNLWLDVLLCLIGEVFEYSAQICGAVVNIRTKADKISIWTADGKDQDAILEIGTKLKQYLNYDPECLILSYQIHRDSIMKQESIVRNIHPLSF